MVLMGGYSCRTSWMVSRRELAAIQWLRLPPAVRLDYTVGRGLSPSRAGERGRFTHP